MQRAQSAAQRFLAALENTYPACNQPQARFRSYTPGSLRAQRYRRREQDGAFPRSRLLGGKPEVPRFKLDRPLQPVTDLSKDQLSPRQVTAAIVQELSKFQDSVDDLEYTEFMQDAVSALNSSLTSSRDTGPIVDSLRHSFVKQGREGLKAQIRYAYHGYLASQRFSKSTLQDQARLADIRYPVEWYSMTRKMQRTIHLHVGPTNSGKTYHALRRLEQAESGMYAGPLRLLAHEVFTRLNARGKPCNLITGDERYIMDGDDVNMSSCTVEMVNVNSPYDVAVVDEIQMIGHEERGWAWTQAVLGLRAKELHLCGEERTVPLIRELAAAMGDDLHIHHYKRLSPLKTMSASLKGDLRSLRKGDCVVAFSKLQIHRFRREIEIMTKKPVAVVYGSLPPEVRAKQAELFNDPNNDYDILVASDAIGMGLNLSIKRIVFTTTNKFNGRFQVPIGIAQMKQIAGRAGRYRTAAQAASSDADTPLDDSTGVGASSVISPAKSLGLVTTLDRGDLPVVQSAMESAADPIMSAGLFPPVEVLVRFAAYFPPSTPFSYILLRLFKTSIIHPRFHLCSLNERLKIADIIEPVKNLTISDRIIFCASPANVKDEALQPVLRAFAECVGNKSGGNILNIRALDLELLNMQVTVGSKETLHKLEYLHKSLVLYLWLSYRFAGVFHTQAMAFYLKTLVEEKIQQALSTVRTNIRTTSHLPIRKQMTKGFVPEVTDDDSLDDEGSSDSSLEPRQQGLGDSASGPVEHGIRRQPGEGTDITISHLLSNQQPLSSSAP
ncbi:MAG: hypothetical protein Q9184_002678 [Pyrenodesmia sp. 2 TL-2023]